MASESSGQMHDVCNGLENVAVPLLNRVTSVHDRIDFTYVSRNIPGPGCKMADFETYLDGCGCRVARCGSECSCMKRFQCQYNPDHTLFESVLTSSSMPPIYECNTRCKCDSACVNRVVQKGLMFSLRVIETHDRGYGLETVIHIPKGRFVCEYAGEIISCDEAKQRTSEVTSTDMNYVIVLREHVTSGELKTCIDPKRLGNIGRFCNHSCEPNMTMIPVRVDTPVPKLCLFTNRDISVGEELTFSYSGDVAQEATTPSDTLDDCKTQQVEPQAAKHQQQQPGPVLKKCLCRAQNCTGVLPFDSTLFE